MFDPCRKVLVDHKVYRPCDQFRAQVNRTQDIRNRQSLVAQHLPWLTRYNAARQEGKKTVLTQQERNRLFPGPTTTR